MKALLICFATYNQTITLNFFTLKHVRVHIFEQDQFFKLINKVIPGILAT